MATLRYIGAGTVVRVLAVGLCALPLAAGYAYARPIGPPRPAAAPSPGRAIRGAAGAPAGDPSPAGRSPGASQGRPTPRGAFSSHDRNGGSWAQSEPAPK